MTLETIVNNMIAANEPESNIAMVIKAFKKVKDSKNKKSPLKQTDPNPEEEFIKWIQSSSTVPDQADQDNKRRELGLPIDNSLEAIRRRQKDPDAPEIQLEEVTVTAGDPAEPSAEDDPDLRDSQQVEAETEITERQQNRIPEIRKAANSEGFFSRFPTLDTNNFNQEFDFYRNTTLPNAVQAVAGPVLQKKRSDYLQRNKSILDQFKTDTQDKYNVLELQNTIYNNTVEKNKDLINSFRFQLLKNSGIPTVFSDGKIFLQKDIDLNSPQYKQRMQVIDNELTKYVNSLNSIELKNNQEYNDAIKNYTAEVTAFENEGFNKELAKDKDYQSFMAQVDDEVKGQIEEVRDTRLKNEYGTGITGELFKFGKITAPALLNDINGGVLKNENENLKKEYLRISKAPEGSMVERNPTSFGASGAIGLGGQTSFTRSIEKGVREDILQQINSEIDANDKKLFDAYVNTADFQKELALFDQPELFDEDGITLDDVGRIMTEQGLNFLGTLATIGLYGGAREGAAVMNEILGKKAAKNLNITLDKFYSLSSAEQAEAMANVEDAELNTAIAVGLAAGAAELGGAFIGAKAILGKMPTGIWRALIRDGKLTPIINRQIKGTARDVGMATLGETGTEILQEVSGKTGVALGLDEDVDWGDSKEWAELLGQTVIATVGLTGVGKSGVGLTKAFKNNPEYYQQSLDALDVNYNQLYKGIESSSLSSQEKSKLFKNLEKAYQENLDATTAAFAIQQSNNLKDIEGPQQEVVFEKLKEAVVLQRQEIDLEKQIADGDTSKQDLLDNNRMKQGILNKEILAEKAIDLGNKQQKALENNIVFNSENTHDKAVFTHKETNKEAKAYLQENYPNAFDKEGNPVDTQQGQMIKQFLAGENTGLMLTRPDGTTLESIGTSENVRNNIMFGRDEDYSPANYRMHETMHMGLAAQSYAELNAIRNKAIKDLEAATNPEMQNALKELKKRKKAYQGSYKGKGRNLALANEFMSALSDTMFNIQVKDLSIKDKGILIEIGNLFKSGVESVSNIDFEDLTPENVLDFIKTFNEFEGGEIKVVQPKSADVIKTEKPTLASKPLTQEQISAQVKDIKVGEMPQELATQIAYAYEPLAQKIASEIFRNYQGEVGYTQGDFAMDIAFGDPKAIGGKNSLLEIAKQYDPNNKEGKSLGGWLGDIGRQRAKRIAEKRIGSQQTTGATKIDAPESIEIEAEVTPEVTIERPATTALALPESMRKAGKEAAQLAAAKAKSDILKNPKATLKQKTAIRDKALTQVMNRAAGKEIKSLIKNLGVDAANDYISNNYKAVAEAFVKDKNINKIRDVKTKELLQGWKDGNITKESVTGYFNDPNVKSNTRSDRRNRALTDVISSIIMKESVKDLKTSDPKIADDFQEDTGIVLASKPSYNIKTKEGTEKFVKEIIEMMESPDYKPGLFNLSSFSAGNAIFYPRFRQVIAGNKKPDVYDITKFPEEGLFDKFKANFGKTTKDFSKTKASISIGGSIKAIKEKDKKEGKTTEQRINIFNNQKQIVFDETIDFLKKMSEVDNGKYETTISHMLQIAGDERSSWLGVGAPIYSYDPNAVGQIVWEHAVPVRYAAQVILDALFKPSRFKDKTFDEVMAALKRNYKQVGFEKTTLNSANLTRDAMPEGWNLFNDSWTARYAGFKNELNLKNQKLVSPGNQQNVLASRPLSKEFNQMIERNKGVPARATYSIQRANRLGDKASRGWKPFVPYSNEDYLGLVYATLGKGKQGEKDLQWWKDNVMNPYNEGMTAFETAKQAAMLEWKQIQKKIKNTPNNLNREAISDFTNQDAVRVYLWNKQDVLPDSKDLSKKDVKALVKHVNSNPKLKEFAEELQGLSEDGYPSPTENWGSGTITTDLVNYVNTETRTQYLQPWQEAVDAIYTPDNIRKLKAQYGTAYVEALEDTLYRMKAGRNRPTGANKQTNLWLDWVNDSVGTIMFFNMRSALLQTISSINFVNWSDNNPARAAAAFANQKQYWNDFSTLFNSDFLKQRRSGLKTDVNADEIAASAAGSTNKARAALSYILKKGFLPTQIADSFAIASGGSTFYRNRIRSLMKEGMSKADAEAQAFQDFRNLANESQQSSDPSRISMEQASSLGRVILAFANTPIQYTRLTKRAIQDLANGRGDWKTNVSKIVYYGFAQNVIFTGLQQAMFGLLFTDDDEDLGNNERKFREEQRSNSAFNIANSTADMFLRGSGVGGAFIAMFKNLALEIKRQSEKPRTDYERVADRIFTLSPAIDSKFKKLQDVGRKFTYRQELEKMRERGLAIDNPALEAAAKTISALGNVPADRLVKKLNNIKTATDEETKLWQSIALLMGWGEWELGIQARKRDEANIINKEKKEESKKTKTLQKNIDKIDKSKNPIKAALPEGTLGQANKDGSIDIADGLPEKKKKEVIAHEKRHQKEIKSGKLNYDDNFIYYGNKKFERKNGMIAHNGNWKQEGDDTLPWEKFANNYKSKTA